ncbi:unnamed protein product [Adineta steineri]|uniref:Glycosyl hydrolase family 13 catalytic domain-containing protein n=1 Tax=Adineta steineri TaxID=433720 RepID=A0A814H6Q8_9BILA|nr:unnamed protein product [Adineta steineri]CAF1438040.1 unnamed protein product [Adineta steineri]
MIQLIAKTKFSYKSLLPFLFNHTTTRYSSQLSKSNEQTRIFSLFAPTVAEVNFVSSFSHWKSIQMEKDLNTGIFHIPTTLKIPDGEHEYKYFVRKNAKQKYWTSVIDPYVEKYDAKHQHGLITIRNGKKYTDTYEWKYDHIKLPENDQLIIYEIYVADFTENGQFSGILSKLDYLSDLGINAIELMPVQDYMGNEHNWGYSPTHHFALKATYGTKHDLKNLVDECHRRGIRVFLDGVFNHSSLKIIQYYSEKHHPDDPYYWGPEFNYDYYDEKLKSKPAVKYAQDIVRYWIEEFHLDGIRFDAAKQMDNYNILYELDHVGRSSRRNQPFFTQAEHVPEKVDITKANKGPVDACWSSTFHGIVSDVLINQKKFELDSLKYIISAKNLVNYLACHDNERLMYLIGHLGKTFDNDAFQRIRLGTIILMTSVSIPLIWQGDEFGQASQLGTNDPHRKIISMEWSLLKNEQNKNLYNIFKRLIQFRHTILNKEKYNKVNFIYTDINQRILAYTRSNDTDNEDILIITNFSNQIKTDIEIKHILHNGQWIDWLTNDIFTVNNSMLKLDLKPFDVISYSHNTNRLYNLLRRSMNKNDDSLISNVQTSKFIRSLIPISIHQQSSSVEDNEQFDEVKRDAWDSGEEQYFKWASLNRRPMESLVGRKRSAELIISGPRPSRIVNGIWRTGLVG